MRHRIQADMAAHPDWWQMFGALWVVFLAIVASIAILATAGCGAPCSDHGGIRQLVGNGVYVCNDGTWV